MAKRKKDIPRHDRDINFEQYRKMQQHKLLHLSDYKESYTVDKFMQDLVDYFDNEVDFNLEKIRTLIARPRELNRLILKAKEKNTHPVTEFIKELFLNLGRSGKEKWPKELGGGEPGPD
jgi:hypothetical protein